MIFRDLIGFFAYLLRLVLECSFAVSPRWECILKIFKKQVDIILRYKYIHSQAGAWERVKNKYVNAEFFGVTASDFLLV